MAPPRSSLLSDAAFSSALTTQQLRETGAIQANLDLVERLSSAPINVDECIARGCNGLPAGLPPQCFDPEKISSWGPPIRYKNPLTGVACALAASTTAEGRERIRAAEARMAAAYTAQQREADNAWAQLAGALRAWRARCPTATPQIVPSAGANAKGYQGLVYHLPASPMNASCAVVRADIYEWQRGVARFLKLKRAASQLVTPADKVRWCAQAASCASMAMQALGVYGLNGLIPYVFPISIPVPRGRQWRFTVEGAWNEPSHTSAYNELVGDYPTFEPLFIRLGNGNAWLPFPKGRAPSGTIMQYQRGERSTGTRYTFTSWAGWDPEASVGGDPFGSMPMACAIAVPNQFSNGVRNTYGVHAERAHAESRQSIYDRAVATVAARPDTANDMMNDAERWLDWLLALPSSAEVLRAYLDAWMRSSVEWGPESLPWHDSQAIPLSYQDFKAVKDGDVALAEQHLMGAVMGLGQAIGGMISMDVGAVISGLAQYAGSVLTKVASGHPPIVKAIFPPFCRWLGDNNYNLDTNSPATQAMMARVATALVRYQGLLGQDWGFHVPGTDVPANASSVPEIIAPPATSKPIPWTPIILGAAAIGGAALLLKVMR